MQLQQKVSEPRLSKCGCFYVRAVKEGNRILGHIETPKLKPGEKSVATYWASAEQVFLSARDATLYVVAHATRNLRNYGVQKLGLKMSDGVTYVIGLDVIAGCSLKEPVGGYGKPRIAVPLALWEETLPPTADRLGLVLAKMRVPGR